MIDPTETLKLALLDFGRSATLGGQDIARGVLFNHAQAQPDPYASDSGHDGPTCQCLRADLEALDEWPLFSTDIEISAVMYRILRHQDIDGEITMYLRKAE